MMDRPYIPHAPGVVWRPRKNGWECRWQARSDLVKKGWAPKSVQLWVGSELTEADVYSIQKRATDLQDEMLVWGRGGDELLPLTAYDGSLLSLVGCYQTDPDSSYHKLRYASRRFYDRLCRRIAKDHGAEIIPDIKARHLLRWHEEWSAGDKIAMAHALIGMLRTLCGFGATILENDECARLSAVLSKMRFAMAKPRNERMTAGQANAIRKIAHERGRPSIALAQALQFDLMLRQKDVIGEWVPMSEPGISAVTNDGYKWLRGLRWEEIDDNLILRHTTSKRLKDIEIDLKLAPMVMEELAHEGRKASGPVIVCEDSALPWDANWFRQVWREVATAAGVPKKVRNMDSRAGAITEATEAGADLEAIRHAATHGDIQMTQRYARGGVEKTAKVMELRAAHRKNSK